MAPHSNTLPWKIPWTEEPGRLQSMGLLRVRQLSNFTFTFHFHALEKEMAAHSSVLAWRIPGTGEPGGLLSMESHRVGHDWNDFAAAAAVRDHQEHICCLKFIDFKVWGSLRHFHEIHEVKTIFLIPRYYVFFSYFHSLLSVKWSFPEVMWCVILQQILVEADITPFLPIKTLKRLEKYMQ